MILAIASGKGGTGKTTVAVSLALSADKSMQFLDCDVEAPNAYIFLKPKIDKKIIVTAKMPQIDLLKCDFCAECSAVCAFNAIATIANKVLVFPELCHSCGACEYLCHNQAISATEQPIGAIEFGGSDKIDFIQGTLDTGKPSAIPLIKMAKKYISHDKLTIIDVSPGTSCAMVHAVTDANYCILVTEPTPFGLNDLKLAIEALVKLKIPFGVIINRCDLGNDEVEKYCLEQNIKILMCIPFLRDIAANYAIGKPLIESFPEYKKEFQRVLANIETNYG